MQSWPNCRSAPWCPPLSHSWSCTTATYPATSLVPAVVEMYLASGQWGRDPYWCEPWPSALAMAEQLLTRPGLVAGERVTEVGCGLGLAGLAAAVAGVGTNSPTAARCLSAHMCSATPRQV